MDAEQAAIRPWWSKALPFLGRPPALTRPKWRLLGVVGAANLFDTYAMAILGLALPQIQAGLGVAESEVGSLTAIVRLGVIPAILFTVLADRMGRRLLLLGTILGFTLICGFFVPETANRDLEAIAPEL
jgi:predicted MFS family arabinose efflux permease